ncbi:ethanolamine utilization protein [Cohnella endophytica]|uniref:Ethanolamine utilization protein n=2 Tax=Cohnella endophytica TaxID=2419778 RepID=A0A494Y3J9_9BACL|nr:ethanolamine utilization protein [Cohnella endophytica]
MESSWITSAGIDVGTSTTKLIVSRLKLARTSGALSLPRYEIAERELLYASPIYDTPLIGTDEIDAERVWGLLSGELQKSGVAKSDLKSGAVIITGETATKRNASRIVHLLAEQAGDFVVATAGADLEGILAGKGAGADLRSLRTKGAVANIDVGGGTANVAIFRRGKAVATVTYRIGGKLIQLDRQGTLLFISPSIRPWLEANGYALQTGATIPFGRLREISLKLCRAMLEDLTGDGTGEEARLLRLGQPLAASPAIEEWRVSGGVGELMNGKSPETLAETALYQDMGPLLAHSLKACMENYTTIRIALPEETVRATVIGAGMQSTEISGATVFMDAKLLPIRNLPVLKTEIGEALREQPSRLTELLADTMRTGAALYDRESSPPFAIAIDTGRSAPGYAFMQLLAERLHEQYSRYFPHCGVLAVICERDMAQAFGQALQRRCGERTRVLCIDQIRVEHGDYIDLGEPISGMMIPVVVKTLAFDSGKG